ncbi:uncharacterized protein LOC134832511 [Culicoides brevitarsis]|uniref:uncharacterized protein LOC134832511 n=1 Tax=Culicoides brevitarsis TaxID=469753 RepID=UPI00307B26D0
MNLRKIFILLFAFASFECYSSNFIFNGVGMVTKLAGLGFSIEKLIAGNAMNHKLDEIIKKLDAMNTKMDFLVENNGLYSNWLQLRSTLRSRMNAIYRDIPRNLTDIECAAIASSVIGDNSDSIHQLIQRLHDMLFDSSLSHGSVFDFLKENIHILSSRKNVPAETFIYDFYLGVMSLEMQAAIGLEFQFDVFKYVYPDHNEDRRNIERNNTKTRVPKTSLKFKEYMESAKLHVKRDNYKVQDWLCVGQLQADPGYIISDFKLESVKRRKKFKCFGLACRNPPIVFEMYWHPKIQQSKLGPMGLIDPKTSSWKRIEDYNVGNIDALRDTRFENVNDIIPSNANNQYALTAISLNRVSRGNVKVQKKYVKFDFETGSLEGREKPNQVISVDSFANTPVTNVRVSKSGSNLDVELNRFDYSVLI